MCKGFMQIHRKNSLGLAQQAVWITYQTKAASSVTAENIFCLKLEWICNGSRSVGSQLFMETKPEVVSDRILFPVHRNPSEIIPVCARLHRVLGIKAKWTAYQRMLDLKKTNLKND